MGTDCSEEISGYWINFILQSTIDLHTINYINPILAIWIVNGNRNIGDITPNNSFQRNLRPFSPTNVSGVYFSEFETDVTTDDFSAWSIIYRRNDFYLNQNFSNRLKVYHQYWMFSTMDLSGLFTDPSYSTFLSSFFRITNHNSFGLTSNEVLDLSKNRILFLANNFDTFLTEVNGPTFNLNSIDDSINRQLLRIGKFTFSGAFDISNTITLHIPNGIQTIDLNPDNLIEVPRQIFPNLRNIYFDNSSNLTAINAFSFIRNLELREVFFPSKLETIQEKSFQHCINLRSVYLDNNINEIRNFAFFQCTSLVSAVIDIDAPLTVIPQYCFQECVDLQSFTITRNIKTISEYAFHQCVNLVSFIFPSDASSIQYIGENAFAFCSSLRFFKFPTTNNINTNVIVNPSFKGDNIMNKVTKANQFIKVINDELTLNDNIVNEPDNYNIIDDKTISLLKGIGSYAFIDCTSLEDINLEDTNIGIINEALFLNCKSLTQITIPRTVKEIGRVAFWGCAKLKNVLFQGPSNEPFNAELMNRFILQNGNSLLVTNIGTSFKLSASQISLLQNIQTLSLLYKDNRLRSINNFAFALCQKLETIVIPPNVTNIGDYAFYSCLNLKYIYILGSLPAPFNSLFGYTDSSIFGNDNSDNLVTNKIIIDRINRLFNSQSYFPQLTNDGSGGQVYDIACEQSNIGGVGTSNIGTVNIIYVSNLAVGSSNEEQLKTARLPRDIIKIPSNKRMGNDAKLTSQSPQVIIYDIRSGFITNMNGFFTSNTISNMPDVYKLTLGQFKQNPDSPINLFSDTQNNAIVTDLNSLVNHPQHKFFNTFSTINALFQQYVNNAVNTTYDSDNSELYNMIETFIGKFDNSRNYCIDVKDASNQTKIIGDTDFILFNQNFLTNITSSALEFEISTGFLIPLLTKFKYFAAGIDIMRTIFIGGSESRTNILKFFGAWAKQPPSIDISFSTKEALLRTFVTSTNISEYNASTIFSIPNSPNSSFFSVDDGSYIYHRYNNGYGYEISNNEGVYYLVQASYTSDELKLLNYLNKLRQEYSSLDKIFIYSDSTTSPNTYQSQSIAILRCTLFEILGFPLRRVSLSNSLTPFNEIQSNKSNWSFKGGERGQLHPPKFGHQNMFANKITLNTQLGLYWDPSRNQQDEDFARNLFEPGKVSVGDFTLGELEVPSLSLPNSKLYRFTKSNILKDIFSYELSNSLVNQNKIYQFTISGEGYTTTISEDASSNNYRELFYGLQVTLLQYPVALRTIIILLSDFFNDRVNDSVSLFYAWLKTNLNNYTFFNFLKNLNMDKILDKITIFTTVTLPILITNAVSNNIESAVLATGSEIHNIIRGNEGFDIASPDKLTNEDITAIINSNTNNDNDNEKNQILNKLISGNLSLVNNSDLSGARRAVSQIKDNTNVLIEWLNNRLRERVPSGFRIGYRGYGNFDRDGNFQILTDANQRLLHDNTHQGVMRISRNNQIFVTLKQARIAEELLSDEVFFDVSAQTSKRSTLINQIRDIMQNATESTFRHVMSQIQGGRTSFFTSINLTETYIDSLGPFIDGTSDLITHLNQALDLSNQFTEFFSRIFLLKVFKNTNCPLSISDDYYKSHVDDVSGLSNDNIQGYIWSSFVAFSGLLYQQQQPTGFSSDLSSIVQTIYFDNRFSNESYITLSVNGHVDLSGANSDYIIQISKLRKITFGEILTEFFLILSSYINIRNRWRTSEVYNLFLNQSN